ncbi:DUF1492 domain-containing protein [Streptococcus suis]|nr:DUF1492 domain-containing protein [Streptococcus suis]
MFASIMRGAKIFHSKRLQRCGLFVIWMNVNKVQGGQKIQLDERYIDIFSMQDSLKEYMEDATEEAIKRRIELSRLIDKMPKPASRTILRMVYIQKASVYDMIEFLQCSKTTFYKKKKDAIRELGAVIDKSELK